MNTILCLGLQVNFEWGQSWNAWRQLPKNATCQILPKVGFNLMKLFLKLFIYFDCSLLNYVAWLSFDMAFYVTLFLSKVLSS